jgi:hypothetical protein
MVRTVGLCREDFVSQREGGQIGKNPTDCHGLITAQSVWRRRRAAYVDLAGKQGGGRFESRCVPKLDLQFGDVLPCQVPHDYDETVFGEAWIALSRRRARNGGNGLFYR